MNEVTLRRPGWRAPPGVCAAVTERAGGVSTGRYASLNLGPGTGDRPEAVAANRARLSAALGLEHLQWLTQVHGCECLHASHATVAEEPDADALWTTEPGFGLAIMTADCLPVLLADPRGRWVAAIHAGWRGLVGGVLERTLAALPASGTGSVAWLGPAIGPCHYQVGPDVAEPVRAGGHANALLPDAAPDRWRLDLYRFAGDVLRDHGVSAVFGGDGCAFEDRGLYSHRRDGVTGRFASVVWLDLR